MVFSSAFLDTLAVASDDTGLHPVFSDGQGNFLEGVARDACRWVDTFSKREAARLGVLGKKGIATVDPSLANVLEGVGGGDDRIFVTVRGEKVYSHEATVKMLKQRCERISSRPGLLEPWLADFQERALAFDTAKAQA